MALKVQGREGHTRAGCSITLSKRPAEVLHVSSYRSQPASSPGSTSHRPISSARHLFYGGSEAGCMSKGDAKEGKGPGVRWTAVRLRLFNCSSHPIPHVLLPRSTLSLYSPPTMYAYQKTTTAWALFRDDDLTHCPTRVRVGTGAGTQTVSATSMRPSWRRSTSTENLLGSPSTGKVTARRRAGIFVSTSLKAHRGGILWSYTCAYSLLPFPPSQHRPAFT